MKQVSIILFALLFSSQQTYSQVSKKLELFKEKVLQEYSMYFNKAELTENGLLNLSAVDKYVLLSADGKKTIMLNIGKTWLDSLILVHNGSKRELWGWNNETGIAKLLDEWDLNSPHLAKTLLEKPQTTVFHPWFIYVGGQLGGDNQKNINLSLNTRLGFFLLLNRWDLATTLSTGLTGNLNSTSPAWVNVGLMTRVHFPIKKMGISPNIGGEISWASFNGTQSINKSLLIGISWFIGFGSLDIGVRIGNEVSTMGGITVSPKIKNNK